VDKQREEKIVSIKVSFVNPNTDEETKKIAIEFILKAAMKKLSQQR